MSEIPEGLAQVIHEIEGLCWWFESDEGWYAHFHVRDRGDAIGGMARSKLDELRAALIRAFDGWPNDRVVIDMTEDPFPLSAYCELTEVVRQIEAERCLPQGTLMSRVVFLDGMSSLPECKVMPEDQYDEEMRAFLNSPVPLNLLGAALGKVGF